MDINVKDQVSLIIYYIRLIFLNGDSYCIQVDKKMIYIQMP